MKNLWPNCPIDQNDILPAKNIFGPDIGALKDKTTQKKPKSVSLKRSNISPDLLLQYREVTIAVDIMFVNKVPYLMNGNTALAWKRLSQKFAGRNNAEKMKLIKQLTESRMKKNEDPDVWITNLERLRQRIAECGKKIKDNKLIIHQYTIILTTNT